MYTCKCGWELVGDIQIDCPRCGRKLGKNKRQFLLGDWIEAKLGRFGRWYKRTHRRLTGRECGCEKRKQKLNDLSPRLVWLTNRVPGAIRVLSVLVNWARRKSLAITGKDKRSNSSEKQNESRT